jgi:hypothetical protein
VDPDAIVFPAIAMFFLTTSLIARMAFLRIGAVQRGEISIRYYRLYNEGVQPDHLQQIGRHVQNHFEVPPLFYVVVLFLYATQSVTALSVGLAWAYVALRAIHSVVHLGSNDVRTRLGVWLSSTLVLGALWVLLALSLLSR